MWIRIGVGPEVEPPEAAAAEAEALPVVEETTPLYLDSPALAVTLEERCCGCAKDGCVGGSDAEEEN